MYSAPPCGVGATPILGLADSGGRGMTGWRKRTIMDMAREAGIRDCTCSGEFGCLEAFAKLVAQHEREACAKRLEAVGCDHCATNIRAKGQA